MPFIIQLTRRMWLTDTVFELAFTKPNRLTWLPGQHIRFDFAGADRDYTPVSLPGDPLIRICVRKTGQGRFSDHLSRCPEGERFKISGPHGHFLYHPGETLDVFVGTGTGVAPFVAYASSGVSGFILLQGAKTFDELIYRNLLEPNSRQYVPCISRAPDAGPVFHGRVTDFLKNRLPPDYYQFYLCGREEMIQDAMNIIDDKFSDAKVFFERFT
ncbi:ferredoxin--NADP reductase [Desulfotignum balticum]|jgi:NAD(P)H-flavin reductase|uniref:ferredoxin--NADP reductase n=1 Tax=Desulfotignum balticum TaxID=115781 RepID=UPI00041BB4E4|nr:FAD-dependent oxidoreductase [Desulfotignum balticum]